MKFLKSSKFVAAALCALLLAAGGQAYAAGTSPAWTAERLTALTSAPVLSTLEGTIQDFAVDDQGNTVWQVLRTGDSEDGPLINVTVTKDTKLDFEGNAANGDIISVQYLGVLSVTENVVDSITTEAGGGLVLHLYDKADPSHKTSIRMNPGTLGQTPRKGDIYTFVGVEDSGRADGKLIAQRVSKQTPLPQVDVSGEIVELVGKDGFRLRQFGQGEGADIVFHYGADTKLPAGKSGFQTGDRVAVTYNGILTRSLPPQGYAQSVTMFDAPVQIG